VTDEGGLRILHVDMDAFYASVEVHDDPVLAGKPVIVGGTGARGVVASCSYEARAYGVQSAMPSARARRLCPSAVFLAGRYDRYAQVSAELHEILSSFTPLVEPIALDEAFMDVGGARLLFGPAPAVAHAVRGRVRDALGLPASVGVATTKLIAKLASEQAKPRASLGARARGPRVEPGAGVVVVQEGEELAFLHPLPVRALWGVGPATFRRLERFGVRTVGELAGVPVESLVAALGPALGQHLLDLAWARDDRAVEPSRPVKSVSHEETYARDLHSYEELAVEVVRLADGVGARLRQAGLAGRTVTLKVRFHDFSTITRSRTVSHVLDAGPAIGRVAKGLLETVDPGAGVRLLGVGVSNLGPTGRQLSMPIAGVGDDDAGGWGAASEAVDTVRRRFGAGAVGPAALAGRGGLRVKRRGDTQWGPG